MTESHTIIFQRERKDWIALGEASLVKLWNNPKDEETWKRYLYMYNNEIYS